MKDCKPNLDMTKLLGFRLAYRGQELAIGGAKVGIKPTMTARQALGNKVGNKVGTKIS